MKKRIMSIFIAIIISLSLFVSASAATGVHIVDTADELSYSDIQDFDEYEDIEDYSSSLEETPEKGLPLSRIPIALVIGMILGFVIIGSIVSKNKSVRMQKNASVYTRAGSLVITGRADNFLYKNVERREKPKPQNDKK